MRLFAHRYEGYGSTTRLGPLLHNFVWGESLTNRPITASFEIVGTVGFAASRHFPRSHSEQRVPIFPPQRCNAPLQLFSDCKSQCRSTH